MKSEAKSVKEYIKSLPKDRKEAISAVRNTIVKNLPEGYEEVMNWGMITYQVPLEIYPYTYNQQPLQYAALASQKNHMAMYLTSIYMSEKSYKEFEEAYKATGKRFDVGKSCVRFKKLEELPLPLIGKTIASLELKDFDTRVKKAQSVRKAKTKLK